MNPAILMMILSNNYRGGCVSSIDEPDHYYDDDLSSGDMDWFLWGGFLIILVLTVAIAAYVILKR